MNAHVQNDPDLAVKLHREWGSGAYSKTCRQEGHKATATPTPIETTRRRATVSPMKKRRID
jgi:hypothetical protein